MLKKFYYDYESYFEVDFFKKIIYKQWKILKKLKRKKIYYKKNFFCRKPYLYNKNFWYFQKKNCLNYKNFKKLNLIVFCTIKNNVFSLT